MQEVKTLNEFKEAAKSYDEIIIYGAGCLGLWIMHNKVNIFNDINMCNKMNSFCDQRADELREDIQEKIYSIEELKNKKICILICTRISETHLINVHRQIIAKFIENCITGICLNLNNIIQSTEQGMLRIENCFFTEDVFPLLRIGNGLTKEKESFNRMLDEYSKAVHPVFKNNTYELIDYDGEFYNIVNGKRITLPVVDYSKEVSTIHCFGDSRILSVFTSDKDTICSHLQMKYNDKRRIINYGMQFRSIERMLYQIKNAKINSKDIVILGTDWSGYYTKYELMCAAMSISEVNKICNEKGITFLFVEIPSLYEMDYKGKKEKELMVKILPTYNVNNLERKKVFECTLKMLGVDYIDLAINLNHRTRVEDIFIDLHHYNKYGNKIIADELFKEIELRVNINSFILGDDKNVIFGRRLLAFEKEKEELNCSNDLIEKYTKQLQDEYGNIVEGKKCGCIIMNCNPFTNGHLYLLDNARKQVDILFVFVLEEDKSYFKFKDRYDMVKENAKYFDNVIVLKSGEFIISTITFPEYFEKENIQDAKIDTSKDILTFAKYIAPSLNISKRFVGQEPYDNITKQYNEQLKKILPDYGIDLIEVPRCKNENGEIISATKVRKYINAKEKEILLQYVPKYTYKIICDKYIE